MKAVPFFASAGAKWRFIPRYQRDSQWRLSHPVFTGMVGLDQTIRTLPTLAPGEAASTFVGNFRVSPDGSKVAVANYNGRGVNIYDLASGRRLYSLPDDAGSIWWLAWRPDGRQLAVARGNGDISLWNLSEVEALLAKVGLAP